MYFQNGNVYYDGKKIGPKINILQSPEELEDQTPRGLLFMCVDENGDPTTGAQCKKQIWDKVNNKITKS